VGVPFESTAGVAVEVDDAGEVLTGPIVGLVVTALQLQPLLVRDFNVRSFNLHRVPLEEFGPWVAAPVPRSSGVYSARGGRMIALHSC
jgi:hypothetical protein